MINDILAGLPWGLFLSFMVGPVFFILLETSITKGFRAAIVFDFGVVLGDIFFIAIAYLGSYRLISSLKDKPALFIFGGIIMLAYGIISFVRLKNEEKIDDEEIDRDIIKRNYGSLFIKGFLLNVINIGVLGFWLAVIISVGPKLEMQNSRMFTFFTAVIITYLLVDCLKIVLAKQLKSKMTPTNILKIKKGISIVLMVFGVALMVQGWFPKEKEMVKNAFEKIEK
ncbi:LysE family translocator [Flavobacterium johnsoniae]|jgi:threonine/homoserine/homoserine lactone efflux protein|uniref:Lysine exporter protein (LYSE/YGGA) n=1 Tax=Flavobacterium johnsoniae (strain ATCC 17061 / DSM 2064 / JCM 8514 / BCRC 14874 / CCUG 350202 / NBRC 14942 / NCIMB 11054 / UW101) TaxID=376686 RepID=A5FL69_FLAJ1|nr:LysE family transporter [Flavobacterium johnsoniae]ABQ04048.1 Lysine exporter protein (LYSE/YGGA) [Flavobacterium johnsoniae UW101]OXG02716.1 lysine transporter LysE [Flavobacterium johnsoniae UW101]WQG79080.1 LysE family transporter [Flavobacterium johnsoniae UW101]SHK10903.1 Threonine/homoserine/homoserine lactone efflux protein [Flavobacterium johnsoniae]